MSDRPGLSNQLGESAIEGLASTEGVKLISITLNEDSRYEGSATHPKYLVVGLNSDGTYSAFDGTSHDETTIVVLAEECRDVDEGNTVVKAFWAAAFYPDYVIVPTGQTITWANVQRIEIRNEGPNS